MGCMRNNSLVCPPGMTETVLQRAVASEPFNGNQSRFADAVGTSQQNISNWLRKGQQLPAEFVLKAEEATGVERYIWRPDIYPMPPNPAEPRAATDQAEVA